VSAVSFLGPFMIIGLPGASGSFENFMPGWRIGSPSISVI
jgi:hypothetical protein